MLNRYKNFNESKKRKDHGVRLGSVQIYKTEKQFKENLDLLLENKNKWKYLYDYYDEDICMSIKEFLYYRLQLSPNKIYTSDDILNLVKNIDPMDEDTLQYIYKTINTYSEQLKSLLILEPLIQDAIDSSNDIGYTFIDDKNILVSFYFDKEFKDFYDFFEILNSVYSRITFKLSSISIEPPKDYANDCGIIKLKFDLNA